MPVSVVCESTANVNAALRESLISSGGYGADNIKMDKSADDDDCLHSKLVTSAKRILLGKIEYEEVDNYSQSVLDKFKSKYIILNPTEKTKLPSNSSVGSTNAGSYKDSTTTCTVSGSIIKNGGNLNGFVTGTNGNSKQRPVELPQPKCILYPRENVRIGWKNSSRKWQVGVGMMNVGNTCYLNSTLQAIFHVPSMANWLLSDTQHMDSCDPGDACCVICAMVKTLQASQTGHCAIRPYYVYSKLKSICKHLVMGRQEDAHEFLRYLVEAMEKSYLSRFRNYKDLDQYSKETTPLNQILGGYLKSAVRCLNCRHVSVTFQHFQDLLLDIRKADTLEEALDGYFSLERLEDMGYKCEACKKKVSATKQFSLERAPIALCIQLKRFSMLGTKINKQITIKPRLDLTKFASRKNSGDQLTYKLVAMVTHLGASQHCGHYTAIGLTESGSYYNYDDSYVRPISVQSVCNTNAYIIFYEMDTTPVRSNACSTQISGVSSESKENYQKINGCASLLTSALFNGRPSPQRIIEPQLPNTGITASPFITSSNSNSPKSNSLLTNGSKLVGNKFTNSNLASTNNSFKIMLFKNNNASALDTTTARSPTTPTLSTSNSNSQTQNGLHSGVDKIPESTHFKFVLSSTLNKGQSAAVSNGNESSSDDGDDKVSSSTTQKKHTLIESSKPKHTLPSMPKLFDNSQLLSNDELPSPEFFMNSSKKSLVPYETASDDDDDEQSTGASVTSTTMDNIKHSRKRPCSSYVVDNSDTGIVKMQKSVAPTTTNESSSQSKDRIKTDAIDEIFNFHKHNSSNSNSNSNNNSTNTHNSDDSNRLGSTDSSSIKKYDFSTQRLVVPAATNNGVESGDFNDEEFCLHTDEERVQIIQPHSTSPSPPVIKTKTGLWQVTPLQPVPSSGSGSPEEAKTVSSSTSSYKNPKNPFAVNSAKNDFFSKRSKSNLDKYANTSFSARANGYHADDVCDNVVSELLKQTHRPYTGPILAWNGTESSLQMEMKDEERQQRRRDWEEEEENDMDRGRQKKVKSHKDIYTITPGYNPFQEQDNQRRWKQGRGGGAPQRFYGAANFRRNHFQRHKGGNGGGGGGGFGGSCATGVGAFKRFNYKYQQPQYRGGNNYNNSNGQYRRTS